MKVSVAACLLMATTANAFVPPQQKAWAVRPMRPLMMSDEAPTPAPVAPAPVEPAPAPPAPAAPVNKEPAGALVPIKEETVEFTAGILGGVAGLALAGPAGGVILAAAANYVSKMDGEATVAVQAISKTSIEVFNYLAGLDSKYEVLKKARSSLETSLEALKKNDNVDPETIKKVESALAKTNAKIKEINDEYDLVGGATTALGVIGDLIEKTVKKAGEINEEYQLSKKAKEALSKAIEKAKEAAKDATK